MAQRWETFRDQLIADLGGTFPELEASLESFRRHSASDIQAYLQEHLLPWASQIGEQDPSLWDASEGLVFLPGIDFRPLGKAGLSPTSRESLWKYLGLLVLYAMVGDTLFKVPTDLSDSSIPDVLGGVFEKLAGEGIPPELMEGKLGALIRELTEGLTPQRLGLDPSANPMDQLKHFLAHRDEMTHTLLTYCHDVIQRKIESGELKLDELRSEMGKLQKYLMKFLGAWGHDQRAALDPRRQKVLERLRKKRDAQKAKFQAATQSKATTPK